MDAEMVTIVIEPSIRVGNLARRVPGGRADRVDMDACARAYACTAVAGARIFAAVRLDGLAMEYGRRPHTRARTSGEAA